MEEQILAFAQRLNEGLAEGLTLDEIIEAELQDVDFTDPKEYLSTITSSDADVDDETLRDTAEAIYEYNDQLAEYADDIEDFPKIVKEAAEAQVRYNKAVERTVDNIDD